MCWRSIRPLVVWCALLVAAIVACGPRRALDDEDAGHKLGSVSPYALPVVPTDGGWGDLCSLDGGILPGVCGYRGTPLPPLAAGVLQSDGGPGSLYFGQAAGNVQVTAPITNSGSPTAPNIGLATSGVTAGSYGSSTQAPVITVDATGRVTSASNATISGQSASSLNYSPAVPGNWPAGAPSVASTALDELAAKQTSQGFNLKTDCQAAGDGVTDDTPALNTCLAKVQAAGGGTLYVPPPSVTYKLTSYPTTITTPGVTIKGLGGVQTTAQTNLMFTQYAYGSGIFQSTADHTTLDSVSATYGPMSTLNGAASVGTTTITVQPITLSGTAGLTNGSPTVGFSVAQTIEAGMQVQFASQPGTWYTFSGTAPNLSVNNGQTGTLTTNYTGTSTGGSPTTVTTSRIAPLDGVILDQYPSMEQCLVSSVSQLTATFSQCWYTVGNGLQLASGTNYAHASGSWMRDQYNLPTNGSSQVYGTAARAQAGLLLTANENGAAVVDSAIVAMVFATFYRGPPLCTSCTNYNHTFRNVQDDFVQYGYFSQQQSGELVDGLRFTNGAFGQTADPGHSIYMGGNNGPPSAWAIGTTYNLYSQITYDATNSGACSSNPIVSPCTTYVSLQGSNVGHEPDTSPTWWAVQSGPYSGAPVTQSWVTPHYGPTVKNVFANVGIAGKNWAGFTLKSLYDGEISNFDIEDSDRGFNMQQCYGTHVFGFVMGNFINTVDSSAAGIDDLNNSYVVVGPGVINGVTNAGGAYDVPLIKNRVSNSDKLAPSSQGLYNVFKNITEYSAYDSSNTVNANVAVGTPYTAFDGMVYHDIAATPSNTEYAFQFEYDSTDNVYSDHSTITRPEITGTTHCIYTSAGTTGTIWDVDPNKLLGCTTYGDSNDGSVITNKYCTNAGGALQCNPQSTSTDVFRIVEPANASFNIFRATDSNGQNQVNFGNQTGMKASFLTSTLANPSLLGVGTNSTAGFPAAGSTFAGVLFPINGGSNSTNFAGWYAESAETQSSSAEGTNLYAKSIVANGATTTSTRRFGVYSLGDIVTNDAHVALSTSATDGWLTMPTMAGQPTGTPASGANSGSPSNLTGNTPMTYDSTEHALDAYTGGAWTDVKSLFVTGSSPANNSTLQCGSVTRLGSGQSGNTYNLPDATLCKGGAVEIQENSTGGPYSFTIGVSVGGQTISSQGSSGLTSDMFTSASGAMATARYFSDGSNWLRESPRFVVNLADATNGVTNSLAWTNIASGGATTDQCMQWTGSAWSPIACYFDDTPAGHGMVEWNGAPGNTSLSSSALTSDLFVSKIIAETSSTISNVWLSISNTATTLTAATTASVTGATSSSGLIDLAFTTTGFNTNDVVSVAGIVGTTEANNCWPITVVDSGHATLQGSTFVNNYTSGGTVTRSENAVVVYSSGGSLLECSGDQATNWESAGNKEVALAGSMALTRGNTYWVGVLSVGTGTQPTLRSFNNGAINAGLNGATLRSAVNGTGLSKLPNTITPSSNSTSNVISPWVALQ